MRKRKNEREVIAEIGRNFRPSRAGRILLGLGDDAALWTPARGGALTLTCDWFLEGTHFLRDKHPADAVGWKCLARAVSDIAAMGGRPRCFLLSLALPTGLAGRWLTRFLGGLRRASRELDCELAGGDTTRRNQVLISITVIGEVPSRRALLRSGATAGDGIYVSGTLGEAELGLRMLRQRPGMAKALEAGLQKHLYPRPRVALGSWLALRSLPSAMMDLSDGLSTDLPRMCEASEVGAKIDGDSLPVTSRVAAGEAKRLALHGGEDYELLFTVKKKKEWQLPRSFQGVLLTRIGEITRERKIAVTSGHGKTIVLRSGGWDPFR
jgi:thiamine-monophosphate kinase